MTISLNESQRNMVLTVGFFGLLLLSPWCFAPVLALWMLFPTLRNGVLSTVSDAVAERNGLILKLMIFLVPVIFYIAASPSPGDDLLREMTANLHDFDYRNLYWGSPRLMAGDTSYWYSRLTDWLPRVLPLNEAYLPVQYTLLLGWALVIPLGIRKAVLLSKTTDDPVVIWAIVAVLTAAIWFQPTFVTRITQGRPENLGALIATGAFLVDGTLGAILWTVLMALFVPMYWISFAYLPGAFLMRIPVRQRILLFSILALEVLVVWVSGLQGHWLSWIIGMHVAIQHRLGLVGEDLPLIDALATPQIWVFPLIALILANTKTTGNKKYIIPLMVNIIWFSAPNMVRYLDDLLPLLAFAIAIYVKPISRDQLRSYLPLILLSCFFFMTQGMHQNPLPNMKIPGAKPGQRVLAQSSPAEYYTLYENPELRYAPAMEIGYTKRAIQNLALGLNTQKTTCSQLHHYHVRWIVITGLDWSENKLGRCVRLIRSDRRGYEIWKVSRHG